MLKISEMTGKLTGIQALNTNPFTNPFCRSRIDGICGMCYAKRALRSYRKTCVPAFEENGRVLSGNLLEAVPIFGSALVRFNAYGELLNDTHFRNLCIIARANRESTFALWTKRPEIVRHYASSIPLNMRLVFSVTSPGEGDPGEPFDTVFEAVPKGDPRINCEGHCLECRKCWKKLPVRQFIYTAVK